MAQFSRTFTYNVLLFALLCMYSNNVCYGIELRRNEREMNVGMCSNPGCSKLNFESKIPITSSVNVPTEKRVYSIFGKRYHGFLWKRPFDSLASGLIGKRLGKQADKTLKNKRMDLQSEYEIPHKKFLDHLASGLVGKKSDELHYPKLKARRSFDTLASGLIGKRRQDDISNVSFKNSLFHRLPIKSLHVVNQKQTDPSNTYHKRYFDPLSSSLIG